MWHSAHDAYLENRILSADPIELVRLLYQAAMSTVREARQHLANGAIMDRSRSITKAGGILRELATSLDYDRGGEISVRLARLYDYMQHKLLEANLRQSDPPLAEVLGLLSTLAEAWDGLQHPEPHPMAAATPQGAWAPPMMEESAASQSSRAWSF